MKYSWKRGKGKQLTTHFHSKEFECRNCPVNCEDQTIDTVFVDKLQILRNVYGKPLVITSAFRCTDKQAALRAAGYETAEGISSHELGLAVDFARPGYDNTLPDLAEKVFNNTGLAGNFIHVDDREVVVGQTRRWGYKK